MEAVNRSNITNTFNGYTNISSPPQVVNSLNQWLPLQISLAILALIPNAILMVVFNRDRKLCKQSALIFGYVGGNLIVVVACACSIGYQFYLWFRNESSSQANIIVSCLCTFAPHLLWLSFATKALFLLAFGMDRLTAVAAPTWYHVHWTTNMSWKVTGIIYLCSFVSVGATWIDGWLVSQKADPNAPKSCTTQAFASNTSFIYGLMLKIIGGTVCVVTTLISLSIGRKQMKKMTSSSTEAAKRMRKQLALIKTMLILAGFDLLLVVIPNTLLLLDFTIHLNLPSYVALAGPLACCVNTAVSASTLLIFNSIIRNSAMKSFQVVVNWCKGRNNLVTEIQPGSSHVATGIKSAI